MECRCRWSWKLAPADAGSGIWETTRDISGVVQVIKPPTLLEISGPMFMSYPVSCHVQFRLEPTDTGTRLSLQHRAFGLIEEEHTQGATAGWSSLLERVNGDLPG